MSKTHRSTGRVQPVELNEFDEMQPGIDAITARPKGVWRGEFASMVEYIGGAYCGLRDEDQRTEASRLLGLLAGILARNNFDKHGRHR